MSAFDELSEMEHAAYEAAIIPEFWPSVLQRLGGLTDTAGGAIACINERGSHIICAPALDGVRNRIIEGGYLSRSGRARGVVAKGLVGVPRFLNEFDYYDTPADAEDDPIVVDCFRPEGFGWAAGWLLDLPHGDIAIMNVERRLEQGPIQGRALEKLDRFYSVFARAITLSARSDLMRTQAAMDTLTTIGIPAVAVTPSGRVVLANDGYARAQHLWTTRMGNRIALKDRRADRMLSEALSAFDDPGATRSIPLRLEAGGKVIAVLQIVPVRRAVHDIFGSCSAILLLSEPRQDGSDAKLIHSLFDLTPAEIEVAQAIGAGMRISEIAKARGRALATVRSQLQSIMAKTGCRRQSELALLLQQLGRF